MGGVHWIASLDHLQMQAIDGRPVLMSPHILTCFDLFLLRESVRASRDAPYRRLQDITRYSRPAFTSNVIAEFRSLLTTHCNFVKSDADVPANVLRVFGKRVATRIAERRMLHSVRQQYGHVVITRQCRDVESTPEGNWVPASTASTNRLDREAKEPRLLHFFPRAVYEVTYNDPGGQFSQSQLALLMEMPSESDVDEFKPVRLLIGPDGCKTAPPDSHTADMLIAEGWKYCWIPLTPDRPHNLRYGIQGKRKQYGLRHRISITTHAAMGQDLGALVTKVTLPTTDSRYSLWMPSQVVVLLSRTFYAKDIYFIGTPRETADGLLNALFARSQYTEYMSRVIDALTGAYVNPMNHVAQVVDIARFYPFRACDLPIPTDRSGVVYIIMSLRDGKTTYIGQTKHLNKRIVQHNTMYGSQQTADPSLQPWALLAIICGFEGDRETMFRVESSWQKRRNDLTVMRGPLSPDFVCKLGEQLLQLRPYQGLRYIQCGRFVTS
jgi:predicted GIY-YIG superfamily endonuclease